MPSHSDLPAHRLRRRVFWSMPSGLYVVGSRSGEQRNAMTLNWATQVSSEPARLGIAVQKTALTHDYLMEGTSFSLNIIKRSDRTMVRKFVKPAAYDPEQSTLNGFPVRDGQSGAPLLSDALAYLDCHIVERLDTGDHTFFVGGVIDSGFMGPELQVDDTTGDSVEVLRMEDTKMNYGG